MATSTTLTDELERNVLTCPICQELFSAPRTLPCLHTFCKDCLVLIIEQAKGDDDADFPCPVCRRVHLVPRTSIEKEWPQPHFLSGIQDFVERSRKYRYCTKHKDKILELYCRACRKVCCNFCVSQAHKQHDWVLLGTTEEEYKNILQGTVEDINKAEQELRESIRCLKILKGQAKKKFSPYKVDANTLASKIITEVKQYQTELLLQIEKEEMNYEKNLRSVRSVVENHIHMLCGHKQEITQARDEDVVSFFNTSGLEICGKVQEIREFCNAAHIEDTECTVQTTSHIDVSSLFGLSTSKSPRSLKSLSPMAEEHDTHAMAEEQNKCIIS